MIDDIRQAGVSCEGFATTGHSKQGLIQGLMTALEQRLITFPSIPELLTELKIFEYDRLPSGAIRYQAPEGAHDDEVMAPGPGGARLAGHEQGQGRRLAGRFGRGPGFREGGMIPVVELKGKRLFLKAQGEEPVELCRVWGAVVWPGNHPSYAVVAGQDKDSKRVHILAELVERSWENLVRRMVELGRSMHVSRWLHEGGGDRRKPPQRGQPPVPGGDAHPAHRLGRLGHPAHVQRPFPR